MRTMPYFFFFLLFIVSCSNPPNVPTLHRFSDGDPSRLILRDEISPRDVREIFRAINRGDRLKTLKRYLESPSDEELETVSALFSTYVYREADSAQGVLNALNKGIERRDFSRFKEWSEHLADNNGFQDSRDAVVWMMAQSEFPQVLGGDVSFLEPRWTSIAVHSLDEAHRSYSETAEWRGREKAPPSAEAIVADAERFFATPGLPQQFREVSAALQASDFGTSALKALHATRSRYSKIPSLPFEGFAHGISQMLTTPFAVGGPVSDNQLNTLLRFNKLCDGPTHGLFTTLADSLNEDPNLIRAPLEKLRAQLQPLLSRAASDYLSRMLRHKRPDGTSFDKNFWLALGAPTPTRESEKAFFDVSVQVQHAIEQVRGAARKEKTSGDKRSGGVDNFAFNLPLYIDTYAISKWLQTVARANYNVWNSRKSDDNFSTEIWKHPVRVPEEKIEILRTTAGATPSKIELTPEAAADFKIMKLTEFSRLLEERSGRSDFAKFTFRFSTGGDDSSSFASRLNRAMQECNDTYPLSDPTSWLTVLFYTVANPPRDLPFSLEVLESPNLMDSFNRLIGFLSLETWRPIEATLFKGIKIGEFSSESQQNILAYYQKSKALADRVSGLLQTAQSVYLFDQPPQKDVPPPLELYKALLSFTRPAEQEVHAVTSALSFLHDANFFHTDFENDELAPRFPSVFGWFGNAFSLGRLLFGLSLIEIGQRETFLQPFNQLMGKGPMATTLDLHLRLLQRGIEKQRKGIVSLIELWKTGKNDPIRALNSVPGDYRKWLIRFVENGSHRTLWDYMSRYSDRKAVLALIRDLRTMLERGELKEAFEQLSYIRNGRMKQIASSLQSWESSGELLAFLSAMDTLLK